MIMFFKMAVFCRHRFENYRSSSSLKFRQIRKRNMNKVKFHLHITIRTSDIIFLRITVRLTYCMTCLHRIFGHFEGIQFHSAPRISSRTIFSKGAIKINFYLKYWSTNFFVRCKIFDHFEITKFIVFILFW